jgi:hypothetical protein
MSLIEQVVGTDAKIPAFVARKNHASRQIGSDSAVACNWENHWPLIVTGGNQDRATEALALLQVSGPPAWRQPRPGWSAGSECRKSENSLQ